MPNLLLPHRRAPEQLQFEQRGDHAPTHVPPTTQGTVGAGARDDAGNPRPRPPPAATNKRPGRVGDSPIIGAGTYAKNGVCGLGDRPREYFTAQSPRIMCARRSNTAG